MNISPKETLKDNPPFDWQSCKDWTDKKEIIFSLVLQVAIFLQRQSRHGWRRNVPVRKGCWSSLLHYQKSPLPQRSGLCRLFSCFTLDARKTSLEERHRWYESKNPKPHKAMKGTERGIGRYTHKLKDITTRQTRSRAIATWRLSDSIVIVIAMWYPAVCRY